MKKNVRNQLYNIDPILLENIERRFENELSKYEERGITFTDEQKKLRNVFSSEGSSNITIRVKDYEGREFSIIFKKRVEVAKVLDKHYNKQKCISAFDIVSMLDIVRTTKRNIEHDSIEKTDRYTYVKLVPSKGRIYKVVLKFFTEGDKTYFKSFYSKALNNKKTKK